jgi:hypothetical protein
MEPDRIAAYEAVKKRFEGYGGVDLWVVPSGHNNASFHDFDTQAELVARVKRLLPPPAKNQ